MEHSKNFPPARAVVEIDDRKPLSFGSVVKKLGREGNQDTLWLFLDPNLRHTHPGIYNHTSEIVRTCAILHSQANSTEPWANQDRSSYTLDSWGGSTDDPEDLQEIGHLSIEEAKELLRRDCGIDLDPEQLFQSFFGEWERHLSADNQSEEANTPTDETLETLAPNTQSRE